MTRRTLVGRVLVAAGVLGVLATAAGTVVGVVVLGQLDRTLEDSVAVTADALGALDATVDVAGRALDDTVATLDDAAGTVASLGGGAQATTEVLRGAATLTGTDVAGSLTAVQDVLPALIDVADVIDDTLGALDQLPLGPSYDPAVPFDDSLRAVEAELADLPAALEEEAVLLRAGADALDEVATDTRAVAADLRQLGVSLRSARARLDDLAATTASAAAVLDDGTDGLGTSLTLGRVLVAIGGVTLVLAQAVPAVVGLELLRPGAVRGLVDGPMAPRRSGRTD